MLKVMTFNLRVNVESDGINNFFSRSERVLKAIRDADPDLIGFQEDLPEMRAFLRKNLPEYTILGCGAGADLLHAGNNIAYKSDKFELVNFETRWLSPTPMVPGSTFGGDQSNCPRLYHMAQLHVLDSGKVIHFINTHPDHRGLQSRILTSQQLSFVMNRLDSDGVILCGDLNALPDTESIQLLSDENTGIVDVTSQLSGTFHAFGQKIPSVKIDYIFSNLPCIESHVVEDIPVNGVYISDHNPVVACLDV